MSLNKLIKKDKRISRRRFIIYTNLIVGLFSGLIIGLFIASINANEFELISLSNNGWITYLIFIIGAGMLSYFLYCFGLKLMHDKKETYNFSLAFPTGLISTSIISLLIIYMKNWFGFTISLLAGIILIIILFVLVQNIRPNQH